MELFKTLTDLLKPNSLVVDLGAGEGHYAQKLSSLGHRVIAVDKNPQPPKDDITQIQSSIEDWISSMSSDLSVDAFLLKNSIQFIDKDVVVQTLIPKLKDITGKGGFIAIETFTKPPTPPFDVTHRSHYALSEIAPLFQDWEILLADEIESDNPDLSGNMRHFFKTQIIARKLN